ncbi:hypothetical protein EMCRGX_G015624 [Ephydatia muelleri]
MCHGSWSPGITEDTGKDTTGGILVNMAQDVDTHCRECVTCQKSKLPMERVDYGRHSAEQSFKSGDLVWFFVPTADKLGGGLDMTSADISTQSWEPPGVAHFVEPTPLAERRYTSQIELRKTG